MSEDIVNLDNVIVDLYRIIDNIDTFSDMTKGDYEAFYKATMKEVEKSKKHFRIFEYILRNMEPAHMSDESIENKQDEVVIDPIVNFLSKVTIGDEILHELDSCGQTQEKYEKYYRATDLFILKDILGNVRGWDPEPDNPNYIAFNNLIKWMMYVIATNPWWHRKLCYMNRMMGVNVNNTSYWHLQYHPSYIPGNHWNENMDMKPKEFNDSQVDQQSIYAWIDEELDNHQ